MFSSTHEHSPAPDKDPSLVDSGIADLSEGILKASDLRFDIAKMVLVAPQNRHIRLSEHEARLLYLLMSNKGEIVSTKRIMQHLWPEHNMSDDDRHLVKALVHRLRRKLNSDPTGPQ